MCCKSIEKKKHVDWTQTFDPHCIYRGYYTVAPSYEHYFRVVKTIFYERAQRVKCSFQHEKIIFISSSYCAMFFLLYGQKSEFHQDIF